MSTSVWVGTSGWVYPHWRGVFYPPGLSQTQYLRHYAERFSTVEVNYSFYRLPPRERFASWRAETPPGFCFAAKASRYLTHMKKLKDCERPLARFLEAAGGLQEKLGPILFQFPANWHADLDRLRAFLALLPAGYRYAFEFRHPSWLSAEVFGALAAFGCALCIPDAPGMPQAIQLTADFAYVRMHHGTFGVSYGDDELAIWAERVHVFQRESADVYVYFNNDPGGAAVADAQRLIALVGKSARGG
ncbi:MAG: DUF72 domain-containing protein [Chloroflexi bacterium]|nr:DUF72 domain-containing protein [Chloroflexota bacterium]